MMRQYRNIHVILAKNRRSLWSSVTVFFFMEVITLCNEKRICFAYVYNLGHRKSRLRKLSNKKVFLTVLG